MSRTDSSHVRAQIVAAWQDATYPGDDTICAPTYDDEGVGAYFRGRTWEGHEVRSLRYHEAALSFFTPAAFAYYLAAYMIAVIDDAATADVIADGILFHLSPAQLGKRWSSRYLAIIGALSPRQLDAVIAYVEWYAAEDDVSRHQATIEYLRSGRTTTPSSPLARLLELAGVTDGDPRTLERLSLRSTTVADADLAGLRELPALTELDLAGTEITDAGLASIAAALALEIVVLSSCTKLSAAGLAHLATLPRLVELSLANTDVDDACLQALAPLRLRRLDLTHARRITDAGWAALDVSRLERLDMFGVDATDALLARVGDAAQLRTLDARTITDRGLQALARTPLAALEIGSEADVTTSGLAALAGLTTLRELSLGEPALDAWPPGWPALEHLTLLGIELTARCAAGVGQLPALRELRIHARMIEAGALAAASRAPALERLTIWCSHTPLALDELAGATLTTLAVHDAIVTAAGLAALAHVPALTSVRLSNLAPFDHAALQALARTHVEELALEDMPVEDAGLAVLGACPRLRELRLVRTHTSAAGLTAFRTAHPQIALVEL